MQLTSTYGLSVVLLVAKLNENGSIVDCPIGCWTCHEWFYFILFSHRCVIFVSRDSYAFALMDSIARDEEAGLPGNARAQRPRSSVPSFLFISFMLFMLTSHNGDEFLARHQYQDAVLSLTYQLSNYTSWLSGNVSNFSVVSAGHHLLI